MREYKIQERTIGSFFNRHQSSNQNIRILYLTVGESWRSFCIRKNSIAKIIFYSMIICVPRLILSNYVVFFYSKILGTRWQFGTRYVSCVHIIPPYHIYTLYIAMYIYCIHMITLYVKYIIQSLECIWASVGHKLYPFSRRSQFLGTN